MDPTEHADERVAEVSGIRPLELTAAQRGMWFAENLSSDYSVIVANYLDIRDADRPLDIALLGDVVREVGWDLQSPFTRIVEVDGIPKQVVDPAVDFRLDIVDLRSESEPLSAARRWMDEDYQRTVDLRTDQLVVTSLLRVADDRAFWYLRAHHIAIDGYAALTAMHEVLDRYNAASTGTVPATKPRADLADLVADDLAYADSSRRASDRAHWTAHAADLPERVSLATTAGIAPLRPANVIAGTELDPAVQKTLEEFAAAAGSSPAVVLTAGFAAYLARMTGTDDVVLSLPVTGRATARIKRAGGMLSNMLPVVARGVTGRTLHELVAQIQAEMTGALRHQRYRFEDVRVDAGMGSSNTASFGPIINMMFFDKPIELVGAEVDYQILTSGILEDLRVNLYQAGPDEQLTVDLHGNPSLYRQDELERHLRRFVTFLEQLPTAADLVIGDVALLVEDEQHQLLAAGAGPDIDTPDEGARLLDAFEQQVRRSPEATAIEFGDRTWSYARFDGLRLALARRLLDDGVRSGDHVVVALDRGVAQVAAVYAVLTAGGSYVPVDPQQPPSRRALIAHIVGAQVVVDTDYLQTTGFDDTAAQTPTPIAARRSGGDASAYVIFTSGSTGAPKGVEVGHRAAINRLTWMQENYPIDAADAVLYKTPITFDVSVWELFWPLARGARMVIARPDGHRDPEYLADLIASSGVTTLHFVPSMLDAYVDINSGGQHRTDGPAGHARAAFAPTVRQVFASGEALSRTLAEKVAASSRVDLINLYGPTETAVDVTEHRVDDREGPVPIGRPVANTRVHVLDSRLRPVPVGVAGELYIAGSQLAHGYIGRADLTAGRFVADPFSTAGQRLYRTGDLVRWNDQYELEYLGRTDFQIKIRGQRIELGEIESVLCGLPDVDAAVAVTTDGDQTPTTLVAYVRSTSAALAERDVLALCRRLLPSHMVPGAVVVLDDFPVNASGKLDRAALPAPVVADDVPFAAPTSPVQKTLAAIIEELTGTERIGLHDNIFTAGADSLTVARLASRVRSEHALSLRLADIFDAPTIAEMAARAEDLAEGMPELVPGGDRGESVPLSHAQTRLWFINRMDPEAATYNMPGAVRLGPDVDTDALRRAVLDVVDRHESLRTRYPSVAGEPVQQIVDVADLDHLTDVSVRRIEETVADAVADEARRGFDLEVEVGFRWALLADDDGHILVVVAHHIAADGFSLRPLISDLLIAYEARRTGDAPDFASLPVHYADFALWQRRLLGDADNPTELAAREIDFWRAELAGMDDLLALPTDRLRPRVAGGRGGYVDTTLDADLVDGIRALARNASVTPFAVFHAALAAVLARLAGTDDVAIGTAVSGRDDERVTDLVGMFVNTVVLRTPVAAGDTVTDLLTTAHRCRARAMANADIPFERVVDELAPPRSSAHTPLFQVSLTMQSDPSDELSQWAGTGSMLDARVPAAKYDLAFSVAERGGHTSDTQYDIELSYATDLFDRSTAAAISGHLATVLRAMVDDPDRRIARIDLVPAADVAALAQVAPSRVAPKTLRELLCDGAIRADQAAPAVVGDGSERTWSVFDARTNQLARELISLGAGPGRLIAIMMPRSSHSVFAAVSVAKTGAAFVNIDPRHPAARRNEMLADAAPMLGLTVTGAGEDVPDDLDWLVIDDGSVELQVAGHSGAPIPAGELTSASRVDDIAYLIYTSGSTGRPKATIVTHRGLANMVDNQQRRFAVDRDSRVLHVASPSFDASVFEMLMALCVGARLVVSPADVYGGAELEDVIVDAGVTHAVMTPSALGTLEPNTVTSLRSVMSVGEACPPDLMRRWVEAERDFFNLYGPTEATIWATATGPMTAEDTVTIGTPVCGVGALVLDHGLRPSPAGVSGELYLTGVQLARGYHLRPDLTVTRFVANPFEPGMRMYRTGDRVIRTTSGQLIYQGRNDFQLKIRGQRLEPGEVDVVLMDHMAVSNSISVGVDGPSGETALVAYVTTVDDVSVSPEDLLGHAAAHLPGYMVPDSVVVVDDFALTPSGKIDRNALPAVDLTTSHEFVAPRGEMEAVVADIFAEVLNVARVSVHDGFFELGGNSLSATKAVSRLGGLLDRRVPVKDLFEKSTAAQFAAHLTATMTGRATPPLTARNRAEMVGVSGVQRGMWLLNRSDPNSANYNVALALRLSGRLDTAALRATMADLVRRHETLRTTYPMVNGAPIQVIIPAEDVLDEFELPIVDIDGDLADAISRVTGEGFDIVTTAPIRMALLREAPDEHILVFVVHHISADGASMAPLARDLMTAYETRRRGAAPAWQSLPVQYADFTLWQADRLAALSDDGVTEGERQLEYWVDRLSGAPDQIALPTDRPRLQTPSFDGQTVEFEIPAELARALRSVARVNNTTLFMVTHAAFAVLLGRVTGKDDVVIGTPHAGRGDSALDNVVGMFVNTLALRTRISLDESFTSLLERVRNEDLVDMAHTDVAFDEIVSRVLPATPISYNPLFQVMFAFQNIEFPALELDGLRISPESEELSAAKVDLQLTLFPEDPAGDTPDDAMKGELLYATDLFDRDTVDGLAAWYLRVLEAVASDTDCVVGDIVLDVEHDTAGGDTEDDATALSDLVAGAAQDDPAAIAVDRDGFTLAFGRLHETTVAMAAALPGADRNAALTMALMSSIPDLASAGPDHLDEVVAQVRTRARRVGAESMSPARGHGPA